MTGMRDHRQHLHSRGHRRLPSPPSAAAALPSVPAPAHQERPTGDWQPHHRAVIVHPRFLHTLGDPQVAAAPAPAADWRSLPAELVEAVASQLDSARDLLSLSAVCRDARPLASNERLWRALCRRRFGVPPEPAPPGEARFWLRLYRFNHRTFAAIARSGSGAGLGGGGGGPQMLLGGSGHMMVINL